MKKVRLEGPRLPEGDYQRDWGGIFGEIKSSASSVSVCVPARDDEPLLYTADEEPLYVKRRRVGFHAE